MNFIQVFDSCRSYLTINLEFPKIQLVLWLFDQFEAIAGYLQLEFVSVNKNWLSHICAFAVISILGMISTTSSFESPAFQNRAGELLKTFPELQISNLNNLKDMVLEKREQRDKIHPNLVCIVPKFEQNPKTPLYEILVPTFSTFKNSTMLNALQK